MNITEMIAQLEDLKEKHGDLEVVHFEKDHDGDIGIDKIRTCIYEAHISEDYYDMRPDQSCKEVILIY